MSGTYIFVQYVAPVFGNVLGVIMLLAPCPAVWKANRVGSLGALNFLPYPGTALNCIGWICYSLVIPNAWIIPANIIGFCGGMWCTLTVLPLIESKWQERVVALLVGSSIFFCVLAAIGVFGLSHDAQVHMWGIECVVVLLLYYVAPLSTMRDVIRQRNSASIYLPLAIAAIANGTMWFLYGLFATHDFYVWMPNLIGAVLACIQVLLRLVFPSVPALAIPVLVPTSIPSENGGPPAWQAKQDSRAQLLPAPPKSPSGQDDVQPAVNSKELVAITEAPLQNGNGAAAQHVSIPVTALSQSGPHAELQSWTCVQDSHVSPKM